MVLIRGFRAEDAGEISRLYTADIDFFESFEITPEFILEVSQRPDFRFFVADSGVGVVGFAGVRFYESVGRAELGPIVVADNARHSGVGEKLVGRVLEFLAMQNLHRVVVIVKESNIAAKQFFGVCGFSHECVM